MKKIQNTPNRARMSKEDGIRSLFGEADECLFNAIKGIHAAHKALEQTKTEILKLLAQSKAD